MTEEFDVSWTMSCGSVLPPVGLLTLLAGLAEKSFKENE